MSLLCLGATRESTIDAISLSAIRLQEEYRFIGEWTLSVTVITFALRLFANSIAFKFAAIAAAEDGHDVCLLEKNEKLGKKLYITGKGRCNLTNAGDMENLLGSVMTNARFLYVP